jgi:hypothetical protein
VQHVLPPSLLYNVLLSPFVLFGVLKLNGWASGAARQESPSATLSSAAAGALGAAGLSTGAVRQASVSGSPRLHLGERRSSDAWIAAARTSSAARPTALGGTPQREPRLRFRGLRGSGGSASGLGGSGARYSGPKAPPRVKFRGRRSPFAGRSASTAPRGGAVPKFRKRSVTGLTGTGGSLSRATPRRGTFGRGRSFRKRRSFSSGSAFGRSAPRLRMRHTTWRIRLGRLFGRTRPRKRGGFR